MFVAAHTGRASILSEWIDPSVIDEDAPEDRDTAFDLYAVNGPKPPFSADFIAEFRARQLARIRKITATAQDHLERLKTSKGNGQERPFIVHRTMADPRFLDATLEPNDRQPEWCYLGVPETVNTGPVGLARFSTLRAWMSQWSVDHSPADAVACAAKISCPLLVIENTADDCVPVSHPESVFAAAGSKDKQYHRIIKATHYYREQPEQQAEVVALITDWATSKRVAA
jgi:pimeloyl-ACP methyl ester carboxylesterase